MTGPTVVPAQITPYTIAPNNQRVGMFIYYTGSGTLYLVYGSGTPAPNFFSVQIKSNGLWEMPLPVFTGSIGLIFSNTTGEAYITEIG